MDTQTHKETEMNAKKAKQMGVKVAQTSFVDQVVKMAERKVSPGHFVQVKSSGRTGRVESFGQMAEVMVGVRMDDTGGLGIFKVSEVEVDED